MSISQSLYLFGSWVFYFCCTTERMHLLHLSSTIPLFFFTWHLLPCENQDNISITWWCVSDWSQAGAILLSLRDKTFTNDLPSSSAVVLTHILTFPSEVVSFILLYFPMQWIFTSALKWYCSCCSSPYKSMASVP